MREITRFRRCRVSYLKEVIQLMYTYRCANTITSLRGATHWPFSWTTNLQTSVIA